jgi:mono/diheme cytochrome c family protein
MRLPEEQTMPKSVKQICLALLTFSLLSNAGCAHAPGRTDTTEAERSGWPGTTNDIDLDQIAAGKVIAQRECASCHAIDLHSSSMNVSAPPLREVLAFNDADFLAYRFIESMRVGHDEMPLFDFDVRSADTLIAYIKSISSWR